MAKVDTVVGKTVARVVKGRDNVDIIFTDGSILYIDGGFTTSVQEKEHKPCEHKNITGYHDNSILCTDCHEVIWPGKGYGEPYPEDLKKRLKSYKECIKK